MIYRKIVKCDIFKFQISTIQNMQAGADKEYIDKYLKESIAGDYSYLLAVSMEYVNVD